MKLLPLMKFGLSHMKPSIIFPECRTFIPTKPMKNLNKFMLSICSVHNQKFREKTYDNMFY